MKKICVLGLGYIGLPTALVMKKNGFNVVGVDIKKDIIFTLNNGGFHTKEDGLKNLVQKMLLSNQFRVSEEVETADVFLLAVPTPIMPDKSADMRAVISATESIIPYLRPGNLVILESTSPPKTTTDLVRSILERSGLLAGEDFLLAYSPERVLPGQILVELVENSRIIGGINEKSAIAAKQIYQTFVKGEIFLSDATTAEMVKLMENTYRDINIAIANEFSRLAQNFGVDVWEAIKIANYHPRVNILNPGPGVGGHCISVDPWFLVEAAPDKTKLTRTAREVNDSQPGFVMDLIKQAVGDFTGKRIAVLGLAFKANVDDLRESPAVEVANLLSDKGAQVIAFEPYNPSVKFPTFLTANSLECAVKNADAVVLLVKHGVFSKLQPEQLSTLTPARIIIDTVNAWGSGEWKNSGFKIFTLGKKIIWLNETQPVRKKNLGDIYE